MSELDVFRYVVEWSADDEEWVATSPEFPSLSRLHEDPVKALIGLRRLVREAKQDQANAQPEP